MTRTARSNAAVKRSMSLHKVDGEWAPGPEEIVIGKDILELLSTSMYVDPLTIYREYIQNAADAIDDARSQKLLKPKDDGFVDIDIDPAARTIRIRDNGTGLPWKEFSRICNLGASQKRGTSARGFRGVGRLAGLGYCQELIFRSRSSKDALVSELRWDCRRLKAAFRAANHDGNLSSLVGDLVSVRRVRPGDYPSRFFEVELKGVVRHRNDRLLNPQAVAEYLAQVAPVPFAPEFALGGDIASALRSRVSLADLTIHVSDLDGPIYRPHRDEIEIGDGEYDPFEDLEVIEIPGVDGGVAAVAWILHHGYTGALPNKTLVKGLRLRSGDIQVGEQTLLEELFPEPRFNAWSVGEIHILDDRIIPNGRRDHFEQNVHFDNLLNHLAPLTRDIAHRCRQSSIIRKRLRDFELQKTAAIEQAETVARGGLSKSAKKSHAQAAFDSIAAMRKITEQESLDADIRKRLTAQTKSTQRRVDKLVGGSLEAEDPLEHFKPQVRSAYQQMIDLIYQCASNRAAAKALVEKILSKLETETKATAMAKTKRKSKAKRRF